jgi:hypothetical protein
LVFSKLDCLLKVFDCFVKLAVFVLDVSDVVETNAGRTVVRGSLNGKHVAGLSQVYDGYRVFFVHEVIVFKLLGPDQLSVGPVQLVNFYGTWLLLRKLVLHVVCYDRVHLHVEPSQWNQNVLCYFEC